MKSFLDSVANDTCVVLVCTFLSMCVPHVKADAIGWSYNVQGNLGPDKWYTKYENCGGVVQSPIDILTSEVLYDPALGYFDLTEYKNTEGVRMKLQNMGGHTAEVIYKGTPIHLRSGSLPDIYLLDQFHFHWGSESRRGSEHTMDGTPFPMEMHIVHHQAHLKDSSTAASHPFGLAVLGFFFEIGEHNYRFDQLLDYFADIAQPDDSVDMKPFPLWDILPNATSSGQLDYFRYMGSLTTPPCYETVIWSLAVETIKVDNGQIEKFRSLLDADKHHLVNDYRPTQPRNQRTVYTTSTQYGNVASFRSAPLLTLVSITVFYLHDQRLLSSF